MSQIVKKKDIFMAQNVNNSGKKSMIICYLLVFLLVAFYINLRTKCVFLVMFRPPLPPCTHLYASVLTPPPPLGAYVINGRPLMLDVLFSVVSMYGIYKLLACYVTFSTLTFWLYTTKR